jgi:translation elongation factor EF-Tu-like GTPase
MNRPDFVAKLVFRRTEEGGRKGPLKSGCHPQVKFDFSDMQTSTAQAFRDKDWVHPGETVIADMYMAGKAYFAGTLAVGMRFEVREGAIVTAIGEILEICDNDLLERREG